MSLFYAASVERDLGDTTGAASLADECRGLLTQAKAAYPELPKFELLLHALAETFPAPSAPS